MFRTRVYVVPCEEEAPSPLPEGLVLVEDFVSLEEEAILLAAIDWSSTNDDVTGESLPNVFCGLVFIKSWWSSHVGLSVLVFHIEPKSNVSLRQMTFIATFTVMLKEDIDYKSVYQPS